MLILDVVGPNTHQALQTHYIICLHSSRVINDMKHTWNIHFNMLFERLFSSSSDHIGNVSLNKFLNITMINMLKTRDGVNNCARSA